MTEKEAWLFLAELWSKPMTRGECVGVRLGWLWSPGLCGCIGKLGVNKEVMLAKVTAKHNEIDPHSAYIWPCNAEGAAARSEFCKTMAENL